MSLLNDLPDNLKPKSLGQAYSPSSSFFDLAASSASYSFNNLNTIQTIGKNAVGFWTSYDKYKDSGGSPFNVKEFLNWRRENPEAEENIKSMMDFMHSLKGGAAASKQAFTKENFRGNFFSSLAAQLGGGIIGLASDPVNLAAIGSSYKLAALGKSVWQAMGIEASINIGAELASFSTVKKQLKNIGQEYGGLDLAINLAVAATFGGAFGLYGYHARKKIAELGGKAKNKEVREAASHVSSVAQDEISNLDKVTNLSVKEAAAKKNTVVNYDHKKTLNEAKEAIERGEAIPELSEATQALKILDTEKVSDPSLKLLMQKIKGEGAYKESKKDISKDTLDMPKLSQDDIRPLNIDEALQKDVYNLEKALSEDNLKLIDKILKKNVELEEGRFKVEDIVTEAKDELVTFQALKSCAWGK